MDGVQEQARSTARRVVVEVTKLVGVAIVGAATALAVSCAGLADAVPGLGDALGGGAPQIQERPNADLSDLKVAVVQLQHVTKQLECPADYAVLEAENTMLASAMAAQSSTYQASIDELAAAANDALARAEDAEATLATILSAINPAAIDAAQEE